MWYPNIIEATLTMGLLCGERLPLFLTSIKRFSEVLALMPHTKTSHAPIYVAVSCKNKVTVTVNTQ